MKNEIANEATKIATDRTKRLVDIVINEAFDYIEKNLQNVPGMIEEIKKCLENFQKSPEFEQKLSVHVRNGWQKRDLSLKAM